MAEQAQYFGTGKRKTSVARVILRPGDGKTWFNGRTLEDYFPRMTHRMAALAPLKTAGVEGTFDIRVRVHGGGSSGQAGAVRHGIARALDWFIPIFPNHITAVSPELKDWFVDHGVSASKVDMVPAGIEPDLFDHPEPEKFRQQYQLNGRPIVMYTGVLNAFQRVDYLLRAFAVALQAQPDALLLVVSPLVNAKHEEEYKDLAEQLGIAQSIIWVAPHALADLPSYLALADVTVVPRPECPGHPVKLLNYMLAGKPVVSFAGGAKGVRHLHDAYVVPNHDHEALGRGIVTL